jgi:hypothetical protein
MQLLKSPILLVLVFAMHASAQDCVTPSSVCSYEGTTYGTCCEGFNCNVNDGVGTVSIFLTVLVVWWDLIPVATSAKSPKSESYDIGLTHSALLVSCTLVGSVVFSN